MHGPPEVLFPPFPAVLTDAKPGMVPADRFDVFGAHRRMRRGRNALAPSAICTTLRRRCPLFAARLTMVLRRYHDVILRLGGRFGKSPGQVTLHLMEKRAFGVDAIHLFTSSSAWVN